MPIASSLDDYRLREEVTAPPKGGCAFEVAEGERFQILDPEGQQVGDFVAYREEDPDEYFSPAHTLTQNWNISLDEGSVLASNRRQNLLEVVEDTVGYHDILVPCCDPETYITRYGMHDHRNCLDNLQNALDETGHGDIEVHGEQAWNVFMKNDIEADGTINYLEPTHGPDSYITLEALEDLVCGLSACPQDQTPTNGPACTELEVRIWEPDGS